MIRDATFLDLYAGTGWLPCIVKGCTNLTPWAVLFCDKHRLHGDEPELDEYDITQAGDLDI